MELKVDGVIVYGAANSENAYSFKGSDPVPLFWFWVKNVRTKVTTVVSGTDIVAKWIIKFK